jgi:hypothetical protein
VGMHRKRARFLADPVAEIIDLGLLGNKIKEKIKY